ncbi:MAG TPA: peptide chain release factor N(5)-glutamine methyltransferase [Candidatus Tyrphobacter sp.]
MSKDAELIRCYITGHDRAWVLAHGDDPLTPEQRIRYDALLARREKGVPLAYLIGTAWFYGREFAVDESVLVPRPETELLVEEAIRHLRSRTHCVWLDVGTGSGAIACTLAAELPNATVYATERSAGALAVAKRNADSLLCHPERQRARFELADLLPRDEGLRFDCVIANLPYIPTADLPQAPDPVSFEPREALDGGLDGLREYRRLLLALPPRLNAGAIVLLEAAPPTISALADLAAAAFPHARVSVGADYAGQARYVHLDLDV